MEEGNVWPLFSREKEMFCFLFLFIKMKSINILFKSVGEWVKEDGINGETPKNPLCT